MNVIFVEPAFPTYQRQFVRGLAEVGATVFGIGERPFDALDDELKRWMSHYEQVPSVCDEDAMLKTVRWLQDRGPIHALEATIEAHILPIAHVREKCGIHGTSVRSAYLCRDKPAMKEALRQAGIACAQSTGADNSREVREFVERVGYPVILKPRASAGAAGTYRCETDVELEAAMAECNMDHGGSVAVEEFIDGHEGFYDTIVMNGTITQDFISHYYPNVLEAMRTRWISPQIISTNRVEDAPAYAEVREMGRKVVEILGLTNGTTATHMEWFFGGNGLKFSEIGCRPPGVGMWDVHCAGNEIDLYREWAMGVVHGRPSAKPSRHFSAGMVAIRPDQDGHITRYDGREFLEHAFGEWVIDAHFPPIGHATQPVEAGYMANVWIRMRHPDYDDLREIMDTVGRTVKVFAE